LETGGEALAAFGLNLLELGTHGCLAPAQLSERGLVAAKLR